MSKNILNNTHFKNDTSARKYLEKLRWGNTPICPHCANEKNNYRLDGKSTREGLFKCKNCRKQFTVTVGTLFERSHIPLHIWLQAVYLICSSKKGVSSHQLHRLLGITYKSAWFMSHRIREAMKNPEFKKQLGGENKVVELDETFWGNTKKKRLNARGWNHKEKIFSLVERKGEVRSFHVPKVNAQTLKPIIMEHVNYKSHIMTDDFKSYVSLNKLYKHDVIRHSAKEYVRGLVYTNTIENYFSILKRGLVGIYQQVGAKHLHRYIAEFDFRYNTRKINDMERGDLVLQNIYGKRLLYRDSKPIVKNV